MLRRCLFYLLTALFALGTLRGLVLVARHLLPWYTILLLLLPAYAAVRCFRIARWGAGGPR
jgi:hypothetical protein